MNVEFPETPQANPEDDDDGDRESMAKREGFSQQSEETPTPSPVDEGSYTQEVTTFRDAQDTDHIVKDLEKLKDRLEDNGDRKDTP